MSGDIIIMAAPTRQGTSTANDASPAIKNPRPRRWVGLSNDAAERIVSREGGLGEDAATGRPKSGSAVLWD